MPACKDIPYVLDKLSWMRAERIWPNGQRYTWTDAFGVVLLVSLYAELGEQRFLDEAEWVVSEVDRVLGRPRGIRIGEAPDRDGQYFHYLAMWLYALSVLARHVPAYRAQGCRSRAPDSRRICCAGERRCLEDEGGFERALSRLRFRRARCFRRLRLLSMPR